jgi:hypothetical protein
MPHAVAQDAGRREADGGGGGVRETREPMPRVSDAGRWALGRRRGVPRTCVFCLTLMVSKDSGPVVKLSISVCPSDFSAPGAALHHANPAIHEASRANPLVTRRNHRREGIAIDRTPLSPPTARHPPDTACAVPSSQNPATSTPVSMLVHSARCMRAGIGGFRGMPLCMRTQKPPLPPRGGLALRSDPPHTRLYTPHTAGAWVFGSSIAVPSCLSSACRPFRRA